MTTRLIFGVLFVAVIAAALWLQIDPQEKIKKQEDDQRAQYAKTVLQSVNDFFTARGRMPWTDDLASKTAATPLSFVAVSDPVVGICADKSCATSGEMGEKTFPPDKNAAGMLVGKGVKPEDPVYICFLPESQNYRKQTGSLVSLEEHLNQTQFSGSMSACRDDVNWTDDFCYVCLK